MCLPGTDTSWRRVSDSDPLPITGATPDTSDHPYQNGYGSAGAGKDRNSHPDNHTTKKLSIITTNTLILSAGNHIKYDRRRHDGGIENILSYKHKEDYDGQEIQTG
jgi:hypothetical protein